MDEKANEIAMELEEIQGKMDELLEQARQLLLGAPRRIADRAGAYWYGQMTMALDGDHEYLGRCPCTMADTIAELYGE